MNAKDKALHDRLSKLSGNAFDKAYMRAMIEDHQEDVSEFRQESQSAKDPDVRQFAAKTLPTLEEHLRIAEDTGSQER
jgi:putative membrane protein